MKLKLSILLTTLVIVTLMLPVFINRIDRHVKEDVSGLVEITDPISDVSISAYPTPPEIIPILPPYPEPPPAPRPIPICYEYWYQGEYKGIVCYQP